ncbi:hypothetical protein L486_02020 [Kwoniella mangroviensis CBS 10435]|uniref:Uncharacterized protein n=1 Tax=Kwoniella mangroviensis CBS 10435 TaxID=1331196 RepID=A0A1B9J3I2_9TREE|nr:hypothetical protein L486_02020 [Kwoniella mangroviensis CBS 10435]
MNPQEHIRVSDYLGSRDRSSYVKSFPEAFSRPDSISLAMISAFDDHMEFTLTAASKARYIAAMESSNVRSNADKKSEISQAYAIFQESLEAVMQKLVNSSKQSINLELFMQSEEIGDNPLVQTWADLYCQGPGATHLENRDKLLRILDNVPHSDEGDTSDGSHFLDFYSSKG